MTTDAPDLGELGRLAQALGLVDADGHVVQDWFANPGDHVATMLGSATQREALLGFVASLLDQDGAGAGATTLLRHGPLRVALTTDVTTEAGWVHLGARVQVEVAPRPGQAGLSATVDVPFLAVTAVPGPSHPPRLLLDDPAGVLHGALAVVLPPETDAGAGVRLDRAELGFTLPVRSATPPTVELALRGLVMPGGSGDPRDVVVSARSVADLDDALLSLVTGLLRAQAAALPAGSPLTGLARLLGLDASAVPDLPLADLTAHGPRALAAWFADALSRPDARTAWLQGLSSLLGGTVVGAGADALVETALGPDVALRIGVRVEPGAAGPPRVVPHVEAVLAGSSGVSLALVVEPVSLDLGTGVAVALPVLRVQARVGGAGGADLLPPGPRAAGLSFGVRAIVAGLGLDHGRRPAPVLAAEHVDLGGGVVHELLDLSCPEALAEAGGALLTDVVRQLLARLGPAAEAVGHLVGVSDPPGAALPPLDVARLLADPVGALAARWARVLAAAPDEVRALLTVARDLLAEPAASAVDVTGDGTAVLPWRVPLAGAAGDPAKAELVLWAGGAAGARVLTVALDAGVRVADLGNGLAGGRVAVGAVVARLELDARRVSFLPSVEASVALTGAGGSGLRVGLGPDAALQAAELGVSLTWVAGTGISVHPHVTAGRVELPGGPLPDDVVRAVLTGDLAALGDQAWRAVEELAGHLAGTGPAWLSDLAGVLGWVPSVGTPTAPRLSLAAVVAAPADALRGWLGEVGAAASDDPRLLQGALDVLARALGLPRLGNGWAGDPWRLLLGLGLELVGQPGGEPPVTAVPAALRGWRPGDTGFEPPALLEALAQERAVDAVVADLLSGLGPVPSGVVPADDAGTPGRGLADLLTRWTGTDGVVAAPGDGAAGLPPGAVLHRVDDLVHTAPLAGLDLGALGLGVPTRTVLVALGDAGQPGVLPGDADPARVLDLTAGGVPPDGAPLPVAADGTWVVRLGTRAACALPTGDPTGVLGQAARLQRVLGALTGPDTVVVAHGGAGHAAVRAVADLPAAGRPQALVTVGTAYTPVGAEALDDPATSDALHLLAALLSAPGPEPDDDDLARGRALVTTWLDLDVPADPLADLRAPAGAPPDPGVAVHVVTGVLAPDTVLRAATAVVAAGLAARAAARGDARDLGDLGDPVSALVASALGIAAGRTGLGLRLPPLTASGAGLRVRAGLAVTGLPTGAQVEVRVEIRALTGWLVGGPDPGRAGRGARTTALRRLALEVDVPVTGGGTASARLVLSDLRALGVRRSRVVVDLGAVATGGGSALATQVPLGDLPGPIGPEVRAVLSEVGRRLTAAAADPGLGAVLDALAAFGVLSTGELGSPGSGIDLATVEQLLLDPAATLRGVQADPARLGALSTALRTLAGDARTAAGGVVQWHADGPDGLTVTAEIDLAAGTVGVTGSADGAVPWGFGLTWGRAHPPQATLRLGPDLTAAPTVGLALLAAYDGSAPTGARLGLAVAIGTPSRVDRLGLLDGAGVTAAPAADALAALAGAVPAVLLRAVLDGVRAAAAAAAAPAGSAVEALLAAVGLVTAEGRTRLPAALLADPVGWLRTMPGGLVAAIPALVDAAAALVAPALPAVPGAGTLPLARGVAVSARADSGRLAVQLVLDGAALAGGAARLVPGGRLGLSLSTPAGGPVEVLPDLALDLSLAGVGALRLGVSPAPSGGLAARLALVPDGSPAVVLVPGNGSLPVSALAGAAVPLLKAVLDAVAAAEPAGPPADPAEVAAATIGALGRALGVATATPAVFDAAALRILGTDPAAALSARAPAMVGTVLGELSAALAPLLGTAVGRAVHVAGGTLRVTVGGVSIAFDPAGARVSGDVLLTGVPGVERLAAHVVASPAGGLELLDVTVGPAAIEVPGPGAAAAFVLRPFARVRTSVATAPTGVLVEVGLGVGEQHSFGVRIVPGAASTAVAATLVGAARTETTDPGQVALAGVGALVELAAGTVLSLPDVQAGLGAAALGTHVRDLLARVLLDGTGQGLDPTLVDDVVGAVTSTTPLLRRLGQALRNVATAPGASVQVPGGPTFSVHADGDRLGLRVSLDGPLALSSGDVTVTLCASGASDSIWPHDAPGVTLWLADVPAVGELTLRPGVLVEDLGLRITKSSGPLLDSAVRLDGVALHLLGEVADTGAGPDVRFGARLELAGLSVSFAGAGGSSGGTNPVAAGIMRDAGGGGSPPRPAFSPALAVVRGTDGHVRVGLSAGPGSGPWFVVIQKSFGPVYLEQVGLEVVVDQEALRSIGLVLDGSLSLLGLSASVDDLSLTYVVSGDASPLDPAHWSVDVAGFGVTADMSGVTLAGGLRKFPVQQGGSEYLGMLLARFAVYGITVYGGYGLVGPPESRFASLFLFGAVNGPIGGPPAFFLTGIGGGIGINRGLVVPADLSQFGSFPLIKALDPAARPGDPMHELEQVRGYFPVQRGSFWFAAGVSFTSFALVDGVAVLAVLVGDGLEISLLGLARMALPRPELPLVSIELGLVARFSTREGELLVQAGLTDNSWLLYPDVRLTGGFAFAAWFGGANRGQFVVTIGGYHSAFHRDGYPIVPRLGMQWRWGPVVIRGGAFFALTSEAVMAGVDIEASLELGPAWAHLRVGGEAIVFFDPFHFRADAWAEISAGITIDVWIGTITISISLGATITLEGPPFHAIARVHVGPASLKIEVGDAPSSPPPPIAWEAFVPKYLEQASPGVAHVLTVIPGAGLIASSTSSSNASAATPDGTAQRPFRVQPEHSFTVTSTAPVGSLAVGGQPAEAMDTGGVVLGVAPMGLAASPPAVALALLRIDGGVAPHRHPTATPQRQGAFPIGVWGAPQDVDHPGVPSGDVIPAVDRVLLTAGITIAPGGPDILFRQVEVKERRPLPLLGATARRASLVTRTRTTSGLIDDVLAASQAATAAATSARLTAAAAGWVGTRRSTVETLSWAADRAAPPRLGTLGEGLATTAPTVAAEPISPEPVLRAAPRPPVVRALLRTAGGAAPAAGLLEQARATTTVSGKLLILLKLDPSQGVAAAPDAAPPSLARIDAGLHAAVPARLVRTAASAQAVDGTLLATGAPPTTRTGRAGVDALAVRGAARVTSDRLRRLTKAVLGGEPADGADTTLRSGELLVLDLPDHATDGRQSRPRLLVTGGAARVVVLAAGGDVLTDATLTPQAPEGLDVPQGAGRVVVTPGGPDLDRSDVLAGWHAGQSLPYAGLGTALASGATVHSAGRGARRGSDRLRAGHLPVTELVAGQSAVVTTFAHPVVAVAVVLEGGSAQDADLGLDGARLVRDAAGAPVPPVLVSLGSRGATVTAVEPAAGGGLVRVTVSTAAGRRLVAVLGLSGPVGDDPAAAARRLAAALSTTRVEQLVGSPLPTGGDGVVLAWKEP